MRNDKFKKLISVHWPILIFAALYLGIFYKVILKHLLPFPGDLLVSWFFPYSGGGWAGYNPWITHKEFIAADVLRQIFPWRALSIELFKHMTVPLWNQYAFSGTPLLANIQSAVFYPLNILFFIFEQKLAWNLYVLSQPILAFAFMYLFIRSLQLSKYTAVFSGLCFAFISYFVVWLELGTVGHSGVWLPFILFCITLFLRSEKTHYLLLMIMGIVFSILAGHTQTTLYILLISVAYYFLVSYKKLSFKKTLLFFLSILLAIGITSIQLFPSFELMQHSARNVSQSVSIFHKKQLPPQHLLTAFAADFFGNPSALNFWGIDYGEFTAYFGVIALVFAMVGVFSNQRRNIVLFFLSCGGVALAFALPTPVSETLTTFQIPVLSTGVPARALFIVEFSFVMLAAFGMEQFITKKVRVTPVVLVGAIYVIFWIFVFGVPISFPKLSFVPTLSITKRNLLLPTGLVVLSIFFIVFGNIKPKTKKIFYFFILFLAAFEYQYFMYKLIPFSPETYIFPSHPLITFLNQHTSPNRVYGYDTAYIGTNIFVQWRVLSPEGYDSLYIRRYGELLGSAKNGSFTRDITRSDAMFENSMPKRETYAKQTTMNLLGVKYVVDKEDSNTTYGPQPSRYPQEKYGLIWQLGKWRVYENKDAMPRAMVFYDVAVKSRDEDIINTLLDKNFPYRTRLILEQKPTIPISSNTSPTPARIISYTANSVSVSADAAENGLLFLSDSYYPGWKAYVDGEQKPIFRGDYTLRAVELPKGKHHVDFIYSPLSFSVGAITSGICLLVYVFFIYLTKSFTFSFKKSKKV